MSTGYDRPLYLLPFDHRSSFQKGIFGWEGALTAAQTAEISAAKLMIHDAFRAALDAGVPQEHAGILVDERFGAAVLADAARRGEITACPIEKSGQAEFDLEYGEDFGRHLDAFDPTFGKVLVRFNPEGDADLNRRQAARLRRVSGYLHEQDRRFLFELLVPAEADQLKRFQGDRQAYDRELRPALAVQAIEQLQDAGVEPDLWKVEGCDRRDDCARVVRAARRGGRERVGCVVLGRGEDEAGIRGWLTTAAGVPGFLGFAVGRTTFLEPLTRWRQRALTREAAVAEIARRYLGWIDLFESAQRVSKLDRLVDEASMQSFPASDPPDWTLGVSSN